MKNDLFGQNAHQIVKALLVVQIFFWFHERLGACNKHALTECADGMKLKVTSIMLETRMFL